MHNAVNKIRKAVKSGTNYAYSWAKNTEETLYS